MATERYSITLTNQSACCSLCGADVGKLLKAGVLTAPVEVFDFVQSFEDEAAPTLGRAVCGRCAEAVVTAHETLREALLGEAVAAE
jgi:hypothetical protein